MENISVKQNITNYKCPACTGPLHFSGKSGLVECDYCGSKYEIAEIDALYSEKVKENVEKASENTNAEASVAQDSSTQESAQETSAQSFEKTSTEEWAADEMSAYTCPSCGAELMCEKSTVATSCPYCGNPTIIASQFKGGKMPDYLIPFKVDKKGAIAKLKDFYKGKKFLPSVFSAENHIEEVKGVYIPFWLYSGNVQASLVFDASTSSSVSNGDKITTTTKHYEVIREGTVYYDKVPADASVKMDDSQMDSVEPYDYNELTQFTSSYLPGYFAESYDAEPENCFDRCKLRVENSAISSLRNTAENYKTLTIKSKKLDIHNESVSYAFLPVWLLSTKWKGINYLFAINGQSGKVVGELPVDKGKVRRHFIKIALIWTLILTLVFTLFV